MAIQLGTVAPDFEADTTAGRIKFHEWIGDKWAILFSHPKDFTPVCTTELGMAAKLKGEFDKRNVKMIAVSVDDVKSHEGWIGDIEDTQKTKMNFPIIGDSDRKVSDLYGMIHPKANDTLTVRSVFFIDPKKKIRAMITYPASTGRNWTRRGAMYGAFQKIVGVGVGGRRFASSWTRATDGGMAEIDGVCWL